MQSRQRRHARFVVATMRQWDPESKTNHDRVFVYNLTTNEITWEWAFRDQFPPETDGGHREDWSHVNDVDVVDEDRLLVPTPLSGRFCDSRVVRRHVRSVSLATSSAATRSPVGCASHATSAIDDRACAFHARRL